MLKRRIIKDDDMGNNFEDGEYLRSDFTIVKERIKALYPKLKRHFNWYLKTQKSSISPALKKSLESRGIEYHEDFVFRWRGRSGDHTLTSGLDDYPRTAQESPYELHVDLASWLAFAARLLWHIARFLGCEVQGKNTSANACDQDITTFRDIEVKILQNLEVFHWDGKAKCYTDSVADIDKGQIHYVGNHGYVSLFPFILGHVSPRNKERLSDVLEFLSDPQQVYSKYGILSLSRSHPLYGTGENYWKGPIWININYLVVSAVNQVKIN